jgi:O-antigen/teichoic acid export membrane protein
MSRKKEILMSYGSTILSVGVNIILLPLILSKLSIDEIGLWYLLASLGAVVSIFDGALNVNITRTVAYINTGVIDLKKTGITKQISQGPIDRELFINFYTTTRIYYTLSTVLCLIISSYWIFIISKFEYQSSYGSIYLIVFIYIAGVVLNLLFGYFIPFLRGLGRINDANSIIIIHRAFFLITSSIGIVCGFGLISIAIASFVSSILSRIYGAIIFNRESPIKIISNKISRSEVVCLLKINFKNIALLIIVSFSTYFLQRLSLVLLANEVSLKVIANLGTTLTLFLTLITLSTVFSQLNYPELSKLQSSGSLKKIKGILGENLITMLILYTLGSIIIIFLGSPVIKLLSEDVQLLPTKFLVLISIVFFFEAKLGVVGNFITSLNILPFVWPIFIASCFHIILFIILFNHTSLELYSILIAQFVSQGVFNYWYWTKYSLRIIDSNLKSVIYSGISRLNSTLKTGYDKS